MKSDAELAHIADGEIEKDIADTRSEIADLHTRISLAEAQIRVFRSGIDERWRFIDELQGLLARRKERT